MLLSNKKDKIGFETEWNNDVPLGSIRFGMILGAVGINTLFLKQLYDTTTLPEKIFYLSLINLTIYVIYLWAVKLDSKRPKVTGIWVNKESTDLTLLFSKDKILNVTLLNMEITLIHDITYNGHYRVEKLILEDGTNDYTLGGDNSGLWDNNNDLIDIYNRIKGFYPKAIKK